MTEDVKTLAKKRTYRKTSKRPRESTDLDDGTGHDNETLSLGTVMDFATQNQVDDKRMCFSDGVVYRLINQVSPCHIDNLRLNQSTAVNMNTKKYLEKIRLLRPALFEFRLDPRSLASHLGITHS